MFQEKKDGEVTLLYSGEKGETIHIYHIYRYVNPHLYPGIFRGK